MINDARNHQTNKKSEGHCNKYNQSDGFNWNWFLMCNHKLLIKKKVIDDNNRVDYGNITVPVRPLAAWITPPGAIGSDTVPAVELV